MLALAHMKSRPPLGRAGWGVYRARDTRLERTVAIAILPELLGSEPVDVTAY